MNGSQEPLLPSARTLPLATAARTFYIIETIHGMAYATFLSLAGVVWNVLLEGNAREMFLLLAVFASLEIVLDVPTGLLADVRGRRRAVAYCGLCWLLCFVVYAFLVGSHHPAAFDREKAASPHFGMFLCLVGAQILAALGGTFYSGANLAWLVDETRKTAAQGEGTPVGVIIARGKTFKNIAWLVVGGAALWFVSLSAAQQGASGMPWQPWAVAAGLALVLSVMAYEMMDESVFVSRSTFLAPQNQAAAANKIGEPLRRLVRYILRAFRDSPTLWLATLLTCLWYALNIAIAFQWQASLVDAYGPNPKSWLLPVAWGALTLSRIVGSYLASKAAVIWPAGNLKLLVVGVVGPLPLAAIGAITAIGHSARGTLWVWQLAALCMARLAIDFVLPRLDTLANEGISQPERATLLSARTTLSNAFATCSYAIAAVTTSKLPNPYAVVWGVFSVLLVVGTTVLVAKRNRPAVGSSKADPGHR
jgi:hypothetical protein